MSKLFSKYLEKFYIGGDALRMTAIFRPFLTSDSVYSLSVTPSFDLSWENDSAPLKMQLDTLNIKIH